MTAACRQLHGQALLRRYPGRPRAQPRHHLDHRNETILPPAAGELQIHFAVNLFNQVLAAFRQVLRDGSFGELLVDGQRPSQWRHGLASVQSLAGLDTAGLAPDTFAVVIVDESHHAAASSYERWLDHLAPVLLLGLTATPERSDGDDILHWFGGRIAAELRLWSALDQGLLCPFHYFGLHDGTDLSQIEWRCNVYATEALSSLYNSPLHDCLE